MQVLEPSMDFANSKRWPKIDYLYQKLINVYIYIYIYIYIYNQVTHTKRTRKRTEELLLAFEASYEFHYIKIK